MANGALLYPAPRVDRAEPQQIAGAPTQPAVPIVRLWPFALEEVTPGDRRAASPIFNGPGIVDYLYINAQNDNTAPRPTITLWYGRTVPASGNAAIASIADLGTPIFTDGVISTETANQYQTPIQHIWKVTGTTDTLRQVISLRFPIFLDQFQVLIQFGTQTAGSQAMTGHLRILERVPPELLPNFL